MMLPASPSTPERNVRLLPGFSLRAGDTLAGRFRLLALSRAGRASAQLAALDLVTGAPVTVQILVAEGEGVDIARRAFHEGAEKGVKLRSRARLLAAGMISEGFPYAVRAAVPEQTLGELLESRSSLATAFAVDIAIELASALADAHAVGLVHGDLSTASVHLDWADGPENVTIADLGTSLAARNFARRTSGIELPRPRAPEQIQGGAPDERSDVWSLGAILYTMLAGAPPFAGETPSTMDVSVADEEPAALAGVPDELALLVEACMDREPSARPASMSAISFALSAFGSRALEVDIEVAESSPTIVVDQEAYQALAREKDAPAPDNKAPPPSAEATAPHDARATEALLKATAEMSAPELPAQAAPAAPAVRDLSTGETTQKRRRERPSSARTWIALVAAGCLGAGVAIGVQLANAGSQPEPVGVAATLEARMDMASTAPPAQKQAPPVEATLPTTAATELPSAPSAPEPKARGVARPRRAPARAASPPAPLASPAPAPENPKPKAADDDLRRFLDDRR
jgi:eukaryotic-like serine/threonine-protein kinase